MKFYSDPPKEVWPEILKRPVIDTTSLHDKVSTILAQIKKEGDNALRKFTQQFDNVSITEFAVSETDFVEAYDQIDTSLKEAIALASENIWKFHSSQASDVQKIETSPGVTCWQKAVAIEKVGLYIPGGTAPLFSSVLMLAIPAKIAGCKKIVLCTPPAKDGKINPAILYAAKVSGVTNVFKLGGIQAIAAMAYGSETVPKVDKIFGPGNQYVTAAKQLVSMHDVAIDMPAGPSELLVVADATSNPVFVASDLLSQAEHGADSQVILVASNEKTIEQVKSEITKQLDKLPRKDIAQKALNNSVSIFLKQKKDIISLINEYAPEHLIIQTKNPTDIADHVLNAGSVFLGSFTPESAGDYASGTNHTLPTNGWAKVYSGVNLDSFVKKITFQEITPEGLKNIGPAIEKMAQTEQLTAHKNATTFRLNET